MLFVGLCRIILYAKDIMLLVLLLLCDAERGGVSDEWFYQHSNKQTHEEPTNAHSEALHETQLNVFSITDQCNNYRHVDVDRGMVVFCRNGFAHMIVIGRYR